MSDLATGAVARRAVELTQFAGLRLLAPLARFSLCGDLSALAQALAPVPVPISQLACRATEGESCAALWLGPDEQLLLAREEVATHLEEALRGSLSSVPHSLVDISHRQGAFEITGPTARTLLNAGCPLDLRDSAFPVGMCTRTLFEKVEIVLWRTAPEIFQVEVWRSFAPHLTQLLAEVARELPG
jgi:sarcosine oxidase subunit gamma